MNVNAASRIVIVENESYIDHMTIVAHVPVYIYVLE